MAVKLSLTQDQLDQLRSGDLTPDELTIYALIEAEFVTRGKIFPTTEEAMLWLQTELGEATDELMMKKKWVRNNPNKETDFDPDLFETELSDIIYMALVAGMVEGVDPMQALIEKTELHLKIALKRMS